MKIRTKLALLLIAALVATTVASTVLNVFLTMGVLEREAAKQAEDSAYEIKADLEKVLKEDSDEEDISDAIKDELRRHRNVANIGLEFNSDEDTTVSFSLGFQEDQPKIKQTPRPVRKRPGARRDEVRRSLQYHGESLRPPLERMVEPNWRTPDRNDSPAWSQLAARVTSRKLPKGVLVDLRDEPQRRRRAIQFELELLQPRRGMLTVRVSLESAEALAQIQKIVSAAVFGTALALFMAVLAYIANRVVGRPVDELASAMRSAGEGDLSRRVPELTHDEIGMLGRGFNAMIERLSLADEEIRAFNRRLADEVAAATADLARKNEALAQLNRLLLETRRELGDKERLAALGQLAAQLAHEIGTPLGSVSAHIQLALADRELPGSVRDRLEVSTQELERVSKIVRDYLDSTRPIKPARLDTDLPRLFDEAIGIAQGGAERPGLTIERRIDPGIAHIETDPGLLRQVLVNLLTNAIDAVGGRDAGRGRIILSALAAGDALEVRVADDGAGIGPEDAARIFEPFYTTKGRGKGTGLGLAICRELASALGGRISVESRPGRGSTFTLRLPASDLPAGVGLQA